jgi:hypothetical protein
MLAALLVGSLPGCISKPEPDNRPGWVQEAEARLQRPPSWQVSGAGVDSGSGTETQSSFFGSGRRATNANSMQGNNERQRKAAARSPQAVVEEPPGVEWGETKITVSVED